MLRYERAAFRRGANSVAGVDEAGRGPLAGPVVAAAVVFPRDHDGFFKRGGSLYGLNDSKQLTETQREKFFEAISRQRLAICFGIGIVSVELIDQINILRATHEAMRLALKQLPQLPDHILVDGRPVPNLPAPQTAIIKGDAKSYSIAAASVLAKVTRDRLMRELNEKFPQYGFAGHKGYGTREHLAALNQFGPCQAHRKSFEPCRQLRLAW